MRPVNSVFLVIAGKQFLITTLSVSETASLSSSFLLHLITIVIRRSACHFLEYTDKVRMIVETKGVSHLLDGEVVRKQEKLAFLHLLLIDVLERRCIEMTLEQAREVRLRHTRHLGKDINVQLVVKMKVDIVKHTTYSIVRCPYTRCGIAHETRHEKEDAASQLHLLIQMQISFLLKDCIQTPIIRPVYFFRCCHSGLSITSVSVFLHDPDWRYSLSAAVFFIDYPDDANGFIVRSNEIVGCPGLPISCHDFLKVFSGGAHIIVLILLQNV